MLYNGAGSPSVMRIDAFGVCCYDEVIPKMPFLGMSYQNAKTKVTNVLKVKAVFPSLQPVGHSVKLYGHHLTTANI